MLSNDNLTLLEAVYHKIYPLTTEALSSPNGTFTQSTSARNYPTDQTTGNPNLKQKPQPKKIFP